MSVKLSEGSLATIMTGGVVDSPIVQVLGHRKIVGNEASERYRLLISDGLNVLSFAMLGTQLNEKVVSGELSNNTIIKIKHHITSLVNNASKGKKRVMIILDLDIIAKGELVGLKIGNPVPLRDDSESNANDQSSGPPKPQFGQAAQQQSFGASTVQRATPTQKPVRSSVPASPQLNAATHPISSLSPYQNKWVIKARVTNKSPIRTWSNSKGEGKLFSVDFIDESGEIRATAFNEQCDTFYDMIEINKVYFIKGCRLKGANKKFSSIKNDYEMSFANETEIVPCHEEMSSIPSVSFNFITINQIADQPPETLIDVIGISKSFGDVQNLVARTTQRELRKREVTLVDSTNTEVVLTLWGTQAEEFDGSNFPVVVIKGARVSEFSGGKSISLINSSLMRINPDIPEAHKIKGWFDNVGSTQESQNISKTMGASSGGGNAKFKMLSEMKLDGLGAGDKPDYFSCKAYIMLIKKEGTIYPACPQTDCNKKVVDMCNGMYRCEKCNQEFPNHKWRMIMNANIGDSTDHAWITCFQEVGEKILGITTDELADLKSRDVMEEFEEVFENANFQCFNFKLRTKVEVFNDDKRMRISAVSAEPVNYAEYNRRLLTELKENFA